MLFTLLYCLLSLYLGRVSSIHADYYWKDYNGTIPKDAVIGGQSFEHNVYIGQAYIKNEGIMVVQINPGVKEVAAPIKGVKRTDKNIKILCGSDSNFEWIRANATNLHVALLDSHAVIGGHEDNGGYLHIGRIRDEGSTQIGKIRAFKIGDANFHYAEKNSEKMAKVYEVLCYEQYGGLFDVRVGDQSKVKQ